MKVIKGKGTSDFRAEVKSQTAPVVNDQFTDDEGVEQYILENGNTIPKIRYDAMWTNEKRFIPQQKLVHTNIPRKQIKSDFKTERR